jgi:hypothetical protein
MELEKDLAKKKKQGIVNPTRHASFDKEKKVQVVIETPKGSRNKYAWDPDQQIFALKKVLPEGMSFPYDFGFILPPKVTMETLLTCCCSWTNPCLRDVW